MTAPPDSAAKVAADLRATADRIWREHWDDARVNADLYKLAARVEALGLEPSERETVRQVVRWCEVLGNRGSYSNTISPFQETTLNLCSDIIAALAPIAERKDKEGA